MCSTSAVFDQYHPYIPQPDQWHPWSSPEPQISAAELRELIDSFYKALEAARIFDRITNQPDCEDSEKAKLLDRVAELEHRLWALEERL